METIIAGVLEQSILAGAFIYMLWAQTTRSDTMLMKITEQLGAMATVLGTICNTMGDISDTMAGINTRMDKMEERIQRIKERGNGHAN